MELLKHKSIDFFSSQQYDETADDLQVSYAIDETELVRRAIKTFVCPTSIVPCSQDVGDILYMMHKYYEHNPAIKTTPSMINLLNNCICELAMIDPVDYENKYGLIKGYMNMMNNLAKIKTLVQKHLKKFDQFVADASLGGYYIVYMNTAMRIMAVLFPDYIVTSGKQICVLEECFKPEQLEKKDKCVALYFDV